MQLFCGFCLLGPWWGSTRRDVLNTGDELVGEEEDGLEREPAVVYVEYVLQTRTEEVDHRGIVVIFGTELAD